MTEKRPELIAFHYYLSIKDRERTRIIVFHYYLSIQPSREFVTKHPIIGCPSKKRITLLLLRAPFPLILRHLDICPVIILRHRRHASDLRFIPELQLFPCPALLCTPLEDTFCAGGFTVREGRRLQRGEAALVEACVVDSWADWRGQDRCWWVSGLDVAGADGEGWDGE